MKRFATLLPLTLEGLQGVWFSEIGSNYETIRIKFFKSIEEAKGEISKFVGEIPERIFQETLEDSLIRYKEIWQELAKS